ncbi:WAT1-related protein At5g47470 [Linum perenne]
MPNLAPGFIFIIAWTLRLERVRIGCIYSKVKIMGTLLCVVGALTMSLMHSRSTKEAGSFISFPTDISIDMEKLVGCAYLVAAVLVLSSNVVLQNVMQTTIRTGRMCYGLIYFMLRMVSCAEEKQFERKKEKKNMTVR